VVQPDLGIVCDLLKLEKSGIKGAPDLVVEILSPDFANAIPILNFLDTLPIFFVIK